MEPLVAGLEIVEAGSIPVGLRGSVQFPERDWPIVAGALRARATHLISGDVRHFGPCLDQDILGVRDLAPAQLLRVLE